MWEKLYVLYINLILFQLLKFNFATGVYFKLIKGVDKKDNAEENAPLIRKEFFQCGREQSCTHVLRLANGYTKIYGSKDLKGKEHSAVCIYEKAKIRVSNCLDLYHAGIRENGQYEVHDENAIPFQVFCDFESEVNSVWTLVVSFALKNNNVFNFPLYRSLSKSENKPNWIGYRLGLQRMKNILSASTMWRATCSFPVYKSDIYRDYMKAEFKQFNIVDFASAWDCIRIEYINIRGNKGWNVTVPFFQLEGELIHTDSSHRHCEFDGTGGSIYNEDNFGTYAVTNPAFRCTKTANSTTQYWFGGTI